MRAVLDAGDETGLKNAYVDRVERHHLRRALARCPPGVSVDLGCGAGRLTDLHAGHARRVLALDANDALLAAGRERGFPSSAWPVRGDFRRIPLRSGSCDTVATTGVLIHAASPEEFAAVAAEVARVLRPGGAAVFVEHISARPETEFREGIAYRTVPDFVGPFEAAGFRLESARAIRKTPSRLLHWAQTRRLPRFLWGLAAAAEPLLAHRGREGPSYRDYLFLFRKPGP
jgi:SAM-dependent methyltransferase